MEALEKRDIKLSLFNFQICKKGQKFFEIMNWNFEKKKKISAYDSSSENNVNSVNFSKQTLNVNISFF